MNFYKLQASGNDFILIDRRPKSPSGIPGTSSGQKLNYRRLAKIWCERKFGIGADGLLVIEPSLKADFKMRIFNSDGSEAQMCGNGARCTALWAQLTKSQEPKAKVKNIMFETKAGIIEAEVKTQKQCQDVKIKMTEPLGLKQNSPLKVFNKTIKVSFLNTGVPHTIIFVEGLGNIDVEKIGREIRYHKEFSPDGTNVNFVEYAKDNLIHIRTYERGVEGETLACGTGAAASAIISWLKTHEEASEVKKLKNIVGVKTKSGEILKIYFEIEQKKIKNVWLEGKAHLVFKGCL